jgi:hypothetical protein
MNIGKLFEILGIDLLPYAMGLSKFTSNAPFEPTKLKEIREQVQGLDIKKLDEALNYTKELLDEESARGEKIESKAFSLIGVTGVSAAFVTGVSSLLPKGHQTTLSLILLAVFYLLVVISLTLTVLLASKVVVVGKYKYSTPDIADVFKMGSQVLLETKKDRLTSYLYCYANNNQLHNVKASYLIGAQLWFRNSVITFLLLALILIPVFFSNTIDNVQPLATQTFALTATLQETQIVIPVTPTSNLPALRAVKQMFS